MSKKTQRRRLQRYAERLLQDRLTGQRQAARAATLDCLYSACFLLVMLIVCFVVGIQAGDSSRRMGILCFLVPLLAIPTIWFFVLFSTRLPIYRAFRDIPQDREQEIVIQCKQVSTRIHPISKHFFVVFSIIFTDLEGNKFYYVFPHTLAPPEAHAQHLCQALSGEEITLTCYRDTHAVKFYATQKSNL